MATNGYHASVGDMARGLIATVKTLTVSELKNLLRRQGLTVSGVKTELQLRSIASIEKNLAAGERDQLEMVRQHLRPGGGAPSYPSPYSNNTPTSSASPQFSSPSHKYLPQPSGYAMPRNPNPYTPSGGLRFNDSPFYRIVKPLTSVVELKARETTRDAARATVSLPQDITEQMQKDNRYRVMVFCAADNNGYRPSEIAFPHQVELKCNGEQAQANLRGLKNKPGSTRPADITSLLRKKTPNYRNEVEVVYALTNKDNSAPQKFWMVVNYVVKKPVEELVKEVQRGKALSKESVIREMQKEAADPDIQVSSRIVSLKCPLSAMRIQTPCRGMGCKHNQCFDATSYLQLQEQAPTWTCPQCNKPVPWDQLVLDQYILDILNTTSKDAEQVTVEPDGRWHLGQSSNSTPVPTNNKKRKLNHTPDSDDDDLLIIGDDQPVMNGSHLTQTLTPSSVRTPPVNGRESSVATNQSTSKRRHEVIDLTLSDDEEDQDARPPVKRASVSTSFPSGSNLGSSSMNAFRSRPPDPVSSQSANRYQFTIPPPQLSPSFNFTSSYGSSGSFGGGGADGSNGF